MARRLLQGALIGLTLLGLGSDRAWAQTVAPGPYYATPSWDQTLACMTSANCPRFIVLSNFGGAAVLDRETGLVWQRTPLHPDPRQIPAETGQRNWFIALHHCISQTVGGRMGWRLPTVEELASLIDPVNEDSFGRPLPPGHPFFEIQDGFYWSATSSTRYRVPFSDAALEILFDSRRAHGAADKENIQNYVWCVRGGQGVEAQ